MPSPTPIAKSTSILWNGKVYAPLGEIIAGLETRRAQEVNAGVRFELIDGYGTKAQCRMHAANVLDRVAAELMEEFGEEVPE